MNTNRLYTAAAIGLVAAGAYGTSVKAEIPDLRNYGIVIDHIVAGDQYVFDFEIETDGDDLIDIIYRYEVQRRVSINRFILGKPHGIWIDTNGNGIFEMHEYQRLQDATHHNGTK